MVTSTDGPSPGGTTSNPGQPQPNPGKIIYMKHLTQDLIILRLQPFDLSSKSAAAVPDFKPGQFLALGLEVADEREKILYRAYSMSSQPEEKRFFEFYIKWATEPVPGKFTTALFQLKQDDTVYWRRPAGAFTIEDSKPDGSPDTRTLILVASGTGLAPFISYILHLNSIRSTRPLVLLHGAKYSAELGYRDILESLASQGNNTNGWNFKYLTTVSRPEHPLSAGWAGNHGRVESLLASAGTGNSKLEMALGQKINPQNSFFHICGYQGTIDVVLSILMPLGFVSNRNKRKDGTFDVKIETYGE